MPQSRHPVSYTHLTVRRSTSLRSGVMNSARLAVRAPYQAVSLFAVFFIFIEDFQVTLGRSVDRAAARDSASRPSARMKSFMSVEAGVCLKKAQYGHVARTHGDRAAKYLIAFGCHELRKAGQMCIRDRPRPSSK